MSKHIEEEHMLANHTKCLVRAQNIEEEHMLANHTKCLVRARYVFYYFSLSFN